MVRNLKRFGNTYALVVDKTMREQLNIDAETPLEVTVSEGRLTVAPANVGVEPEKLAEAIREVRAEYGTMLKNLA